MVLCGLTPNVGALIALRCLQGLGMALFLPATFALATRAYPPSERGRAVGILASANALGFILGPLFAGWLLDAYDWRATFVSRLPLGALAILLAFAWVPASAAVSTARGNLDLKGAVLATLGFFGLLYGLNRLPVEDNHRDPLVWAVLLAGIAILWWMLRSEARHPDPLIDVSLFRQHPRFAKASLAFTVLFATFPAYLFVLPIVLMVGLEMTGWDAGLLLGSVALVTFVVSPYAGKASDRIGPERLCMVGGMLVALGYVAMFLINPASGPLIILVPMALFGAGTGLFFSPNNALILGSVPPARAGMASGLIGTMRQAGYAVGFALSASLFTFVQNRFETAWSRTGLLALPHEMAERLSHVYEGGGLWSPEMLVFILHISALLGAALTLLAVASSAPRFEMARDAQLVTVGLVALAMTAAVLAVAGRSDLRLARDAWFAPVRTDARPTVTAFGWSSRHPRIEKVLSGKEGFALYCAACHGPEGHGVENVGPSLVTSEFVARQDDQALASFLHEGRPVDHKDNKTKRLMPSMRNYRGFTEDLYPKLVDRLRTLNKRKVAAN
jgi:EmrB/QacA subfamily drug resistance transporter